MKAFPEEFLAATLRRNSENKSALIGKIYALITFMFVAFLFWILCAHIEQYAILDGRLEPTGRSKAIQSSVTQKIVRLNVADGSHVKKGDLLIQLDDLVAVANILALNSTVAITEADMVRLQIEIKYANEPNVCPSINLDTKLDSKVADMEREALNIDMRELDAYRELSSKRVAEKIATISRYDRSSIARSNVVAVLIERLSMKSKLLEKHVGALTEEIIAKQKVQAETIKISDDRGQADEARAALTVEHEKLASRISTFIHQKATELDDKKRLLVQSKAELASVEHYKQESMIYSPVEGEVQQLVLSQGQIAVAGQTLMLVVPETTRYEVAAFATNDSISDLKVGQDVLLKVDAFPFNRYGTLSGSVTNISKTSNYRPAAESAPSDQGEASLHNLVYQVTVSIDSSSFKKLALRSGMTVKAEVLIEDPSVLSIALRPISKLFMQFGHER